MPLPSPAEILIRLTADAAALGCQPQPLASILEREARDLANLYALAARGLHRGDGALDHCEQRVRDMMWARGVRWDDQRLPPDLEAALRPSAPATPEPSLPPAPTPVGEATHSIAGGGAGLRYCGRLPYLPGDAAVAWRWLCAAAHEILPWAEGNDRIITVYDATGRPNTGHPGSAHLLGSRHVDRGYLTIGPRNHTQSLESCRLAVVGTDLLDARCELAWWRLARAVFPELRALVGSAVQAAIEAEAGGWVECLTADDACNHDLHAHQDLGAAVDWERLRWLAGLTPAAARAWLSGEE